MIKNNCFFLLLFFVLSIDILAQDTLIINEPDTGLRYYCTNTKITFDTGYSFYSNESERMHAYISEMCAIAYPETPENLGFVELKPDFGTGPYFYDWSDGNQSRVRANLESGVYSVNVIDTLLDTLAITIPIGTEIAWDTTFGLTTYYGELEKSGSDEWGDGVATLENVVDGDGEIRIEVGDLSKVWAFGYRLSTNSEADDYEDMDYALYIDGSNELYSYENSTQTYLATVTSGDIVSIELSGDQVHFKKNESTLRQVTFNPSNSYKIDFSLYSSNMKTGPVTPIKFNYWPKPKANITHSECYGASGAIDITTYGPTPTAYSWTGPNSFSASTEDISGIEPGSYTVSISYPNHIALTRTYSVGTEVTWKNIVMATATQSQLIDDDTDGYNKSGASSINILPKGENGWLEFKVTLNSNTNKLTVGISDLDQDQDYPSIDYGLQFRIKTFHTLSWREVWIIEGGTVKHYPSHWNPTDEFKILYNATSNVIVYLKNGGVFHTMMWPPPNTYASTGVTPSRFMVDAALADEDEGIAEAFVSFDCPTPGYPVLSKKLDAGFYTTVKQKLWFQYMEEYTRPNVDLVYKIYNSEMEEMGTLPTEGVTKVGANYYSIDVSNFSPDPLISGEFYVLEATNEKNEKFLLRFLYQ